MELDEPREWFDGGGLSRGRRSPGEGDYAHYANASDG